MKTTNIIIIICSIVTALLGLIYAYNRYNTKQSSDDKPKQKYTTDSKVVSTNKSYHTGGRRHIKNRKKHKKILSLGN